MIALLYLTEGLNKDRDTFFSYWKSFNSIIRELSNESKDFEMLKFIKKLISDNYNTYANIVSYSDSITNEVLLNLNINKMLKNNYPKVPKSSRSLSNFEDYLILNYEDTVMCEVLLEKMISKKSFLNHFDSNNYDRITSKLQERIKENKENPSDRFSFMLLKYAYFIRNKYFHGEFEPKDFIFSSKHLEELSLINKLLLLTISDLVKYELIVA